MNYKTMPNHPDCAGVALVEDTPTQRMVSCHKTAADAEAAMKSMMSTPAMRSTDDRYEIRNVADTIEYRSEDGKVTVTGTVIKYGAVSKKIRPGVVERIMPGAATKALEESEVRAIYEHDRKHLLGTTTAGTLRLADSPTELRYELDLPDTTAGRDVATLVERRDLRGSSFGFRALPSSVKWSKTDQGLALRSVGTFSLFDHISLTAWNAYDSSTAEMAVRSFADENSLELRYVLDALAAGEDIADLIDPETRHTGETHDDSREITVARQRFTALYL